MDDIQKFLQLCEATENILKEALWSPEKINLFWAANQVFCWYPYIKGLK